MASPDALFQAARQRLWPRARLRRTAVGASVAAGFEVVRCVELAWRDEHVALVSGQMAGLAR